jgi:oxygen-independent coproporphyrinogen-3 oxidase
LNYNTKEDIEVSIEVNPGSVSLEKARKYKAIGINRVSIGLQSLNDDLLKSIGRIHNAEDFYKSYKILKDVGFENINIDLMFALPDQSLKDLLLTLERVVKLDVSHISLYSLILEEGTKFYKMHEMGKLNMPSEEEDRDMYHKSVQFLKSNGYEHYEISNFSKRNSKCKQNMTYWKVNPYIGLGINSHSNLDNKRFSNVSDFKNYYFKLEKNEFPLHEIEDIANEMEIVEYIILGLRLIEGIDKEEFKRRFKEDIDHLYREQILKNIKSGLLVECENHIKLTDLGLDLSNQVELDFFP